MKAYSKLKSLRSRITYMAATLFLPHLLAGYAHAIPPGVELGYLEQLEEEGNYYWVDEDGSSFLEHTIIHEQVDRAIRLLDRNALAHLDPRRPFADVFRRALDLGNVSLIDRLIPDAKDKDLLDDTLRQEGLAIAVSRDDPEIIELFLAEGASVAALGERFPHLLGEAILMGHEAQVWLLLSAGFSLDAATSAGHNPLNSAIFASNPVVAAYLLEHDEDIAMQAANGLAPLGVALSLAAQDPAADFTFVDMLVAKGITPCESGLRVLTASEQAPIVTLQVLLETSDNSAFVEKFAAYGCGPQ